MVLPIDLLLINIFTFQHIYPLWITLVTLQSCRQGNNEACHISLDGNGGFPKHVRILENKTNIPEPCSGKTESSYRQQNKCGS